MSSLRHQARRYLRWVLAIALLVVLATIAGAYILVNQRLRVPFQDRYTVQAEFSAAVGLVPGLGQPVNVAGVKVGQVTGVKLRDGRALVDLEIDPQELPRVAADAHARLVPRTPLKDLQVELSPGSRTAPRLPDGGRIPVARTSTPIDADELLAALDGDTRDYLRVLLAEGRRGLEGRGDDVRKALGALRPTAAQLASVSGALRERRVALQRLVHQLSVLAGVAGSRDRKLAELVSSADTTLSALAAEERALRGAVHDLPATLRATRRSLDRLADFTTELRPALRALRPAARRLPGALDALAPVAAQAPGILRTQLRPLAREARPLTRELAPAVRDLSASTPDLINAFRLLGETMNALAHNPPGDDEGYLFWMAWMAHNSASFVTTQDGHGPAWRGLLLASCDTVGSQHGIEAAADALFDLAPICPKP